MQFSLSHAQRRSMWQMHGGLHQSHTTLKTLYTLYSANTNYNAYVKQGKRKAAVYLGDGAG